MTREEVFAKLNEIFCDVLDLDEVELTDTTTARDVEGWESLTHIALVSAIEEEFNIKFQVKETIAMKNVGEMVDLILAKVG